MNGKHPDSSAHGTSEQRPIGVSQCDPSGRWVCDARADTGACQCNAVTLDEWDEDEELGCVDLETRLDAALERIDRG